MKKVVLLAAILSLMFIAHSETGVNIPTHNEAYESIIDDTVSFMLTLCTKTVYVKGVITSIRIPIGENHGMLATISIDTNGDGIADMIAECKPNLALKINKAKNMGLSIIFQLQFQGNDNHEITGAEYSYQQPPATKYITY